MANVHPTRRPMRWSTACSRSGSTGTLDDYAVEAEGTACASPSTPTPLRSSSSSPAPACVAAAGGVPDRPEVADSPREPRPDESSSVVVNGAEGEPGTFKDRTILRNDPYAG